MRILVLTGIQEELIGVIQALSLEFDRTIGCYRSAENTELFAGTTGPAVSKKKQVRRWIEKIQPDVIINAGLAGLLRPGDGLLPGDRLRLGTVVDRKTLIRFAGGRGSDTLVSVDEPIFEPWKKMDIADEFQARACDMEAGKLLNLVGLMDGFNWHVSVVFCKVVGDTPEMYELFQGEEAVRSWHRMSRSKRLMALLRFSGGPIAAWRLLRLKRTVLDCLAAHILTVVGALRDEIPQKIDSLFIPH